VRHGSEALTHRVQAKLRRLVSGSPLAGLAAWTSAVQRGPNFYFIAHV
jgi:hypothetical protein